MAGRYWAGERGSIAPVFAGLLTVVLMLLIGVVDREWANYMLKLVKETADLSAEAGAGPQARTVYATVSTVRRQYWVWTSEYCRTKDPLGKCLEWGTRFHTSWRYDPVTLTRPEAEFRADWRSVFDCSANDAQEPSWMCAPPTVVDRRVEFGEESTALAERVFTKNWEDKARAYIAQPLSVTQNTADRTVQVTTMLRLQSVFGFGEAEEVLIHGRAVVTLQPLELDE